MAEKPELLTAEQETYWRRFGPIECTSAASARIFATLDAARADLDAARARIAELEAELAQLKAPDPGAHPDPFVDAAERVVMERLKKMGL